VAIPAKQGITEISLTLWAAADY